MELHIFNGDCAFEAWRSSGGTAAALVWRENYLEGRIPGKAVPPEEFERIRAEELHRLMPELDREKILAELRKMDQAVAGLSGRDSVFLWFDACMYDQIMLSRILFLLENTPARVFLVCEDVAWGEHPELFAEKKPEARLLSGADLRLFASAWEAVAEGEETLRRFPAGEGARPLSISGEGAGAIPGGVSRSGWPRQKRTATAGNHPLRQTLRPRNIPGGGSL